MKTNPLLRWPLPFLLSLLSLLASGCASFSSERSCSSPSNSVYGDANFNVSVSHYGEEQRSADNLIQKSSKTLLIMPPTGGTNYIDRSYAKKFCNSGYEVFILNEWSGMYEESIDLDLHQRFYEGAQKAVNLVLDQVKTPFIGMLGTSVGALHAEVSAGVQPRLNAIFAIVGGEPISEIIVTSDQKEMKELKQNRYVKYNFKSDVEYLAELKKALTLDPYEIGSLHKSKDLGMSIATDDSTVPTATQIKLRDLWQPQKVLSRDSSHFWGIVKTWLYDSDEVLDFFEKSAAKTASK